MREVMALELAHEVGLGMLVTRPAGRRFLAVLETRLQKTPESSLTLDFSEVQLMDASFADEVFGNLAASRSRRQGPTACLILRGLEGASLENLEMALWSRPSREQGLRNCVLPITTRDGPIELVGKAEGHVRETFEALRTHRTLTARELAGIWAMDIGAASTRLKVLHDLGLAIRVEVRDESGKQFRYEWPG